MAGLDRLILCLRLIAMGFLFRAGFLFYITAFQLAILSDVVLSLGSFCVCRRPNDAKQKEQKTEKRNSKKKVKRYKMSQISSLGYIM